jgi:hypothetical protein
MRRVEIGQNEKANALGAISWLKRQTDNSRTGPRKTFQGGKFRVERLISVQTIDSQVVRQSAARTIVVVLETYARPHFQSLSPIQSEGARLELGDVVVSYGGTDNF